jgi:uncharacterized protein (DUF433 family)
MNSEIVQIDPDILSGTPVFINTRVPIKNLFDYLESGESVEEFLNDFPSVKHNQVISLLKEAELVLTSGTV